MEGLQSHFWTSPDHPSCLPCNIGFADVQSHDSVSFTKFLCFLFLHWVSPLPLQHIETVHGSTKPSSPNQAVDIDNTTFDLDLNLTEMEASKMPELPNTMAMTEMSPYSTGFTPLSPRDRMQVIINLHVRSFLKGH